MKKTRYDIMQIIISTVLTGLFSSRTLSIIFMACKIQPEIKKKIDRIKYFLDILILHFYNVC